MAIPTLIPTAATLPDSSAQEHPHHRVSLGLGTDETSYEEEKLACQRMETRPEASEASPPKKVKREVTGVEMILKQTAEIGMVLVGMAALRGGAPPTPVECHLAIEAYTNLEGLVERVAPHDLVSKKSLQSLIQQFSLAQKPPLPPVSTTTSAQDVSTPSMDAASTHGKKSSTTPRTAKSKPAATRAASKNPTTRLKDLRSVTITAPTEIVGKGPKSLARLRGAMVAQPLIDLREVHRQIALEIHLSKPDVLMAALSETASVYIDSPITCDTCKVLVNDTSSVLICDGCEAGFHLLCLQMDKDMDILEMDWYCTKCVAASGGRPRQPIYGHLRRGPGRPGSRTTWILKKSREHRSVKLPGELTVQLRNRGGNTGAAQDGKNLSAAKASTAVHAA